IRKQHRSNRTNTERRKAQTNFKHLSFFVQMVLNKCTFGFGDYNIPFFRKQKFLSNSLTFLVC
ncbi:MAG: hypothetical protein RBR40_11810, partial [Tenuifilaceae bacterium]|nr:hypothetical protein [Tenuifilaceae bacterium]